MTASMDIFTNVYSEQKPDGDVLLYPPFTLDYQYWNPWLTTVCNHIHKTIIGLAACAANSLISTPADYTNSIDEKTEL